MVTRILKLQQKPTPADAADALALAICHCWRAPMIARMAQAEAMAAEPEHEMVAPAIQPEPAPAPEPKVKVEPALVAVASIATPTAVPPKMRLASPVTPNPAAVLIQVVSTAAAVHGVTQRPTAETGRGRSGHRRQPGASRKIG
jgi:hypothetical protein